MDNASQEDKMVNNPLSILWVGKCTIYEYQEVTDPETWQTSFELVEVVRDEPCRLSHKREATIDIRDGAPNLTQSIVLFIRPDLVIKAGSVIEVTQNNVTEKYKRSSKPSVYTNHQEVELELYEDKA